MSGRVALDSPFLGSLLELLRGTLPGLLLPGLLLPGLLLPGLPRGTLPERLLGSVCYSAQVSFLLDSEYEAVVAVVV